MTTASAKTKAAKPRRPGRRRSLSLELRERNEPFGADANGILMTPEEFDSADFDDDWRYELINGVLVVTPIPLEEEAEPNEVLGFLLRTYQEGHPQGSSLNGTLGEREVKTGQNRRRADRLIWANLGRKPRRGETPTIVVEFVSGRKRDRERDYDVKRNEYLDIGVKEYWVIDRFMQTMTVFTRTRGRTRKRVFAKDQSYKTDLLPGFELPLVRLFAAAERWTEDQPE